MTTWSGAVRAQKAAQLLERGFNSGGLSWLTPSLGTVDALAPIDAQPPNLREEMCGGHRRKPPSEENEEEPEESTTAASGESENGQAFMDNPAWCKKGSENPYAKAFPLERSPRQVALLDPKTYKVSFFKMPVRDPEMPVSLGPGHAGAVKPTADSPYWGGAVLWDTRANNHNSMFDKQGRIWLAATVRGMDNPAWCKKGSENPYAKAFPLERSPRQVALLDPKTMKYEFIDTCFGTHHPQFGYDADNTLWLSGTGPVAGWVNTKVWDETHDRLSRRLSVSCFADRCRRPHSY